MLSKNVGILNGNVCRHLECLEKFPEDLVSQVYCFSNITTSRGERDAPPFPQLLVHIFPHLPRTDARAPIRGRTGASCWTSSGIRFCLPVPRSSSDLPRLRARVYPSPIPIFSTYSHLRIYNRGRYNDKCSLTLIFTRIYGYSTWKKTLHFHRPLAPRILRSVYRALFYAASNCDEGSAEAVQEEVLRRGHVRV